MLTTSDYVVNDYILNERLGTPTQCVFCLSE